MKIKIIKNLDIFNLKKGEIYKHPLGDDYLLIDVIGQRVGDKSLVIPMQLLIYHKYAKEVKSGKN